MAPGVRWKFDDSFDAINRRTGQAHRGGPFQYRGTFQGRDGRVIEGVDFEGDWMQFSLADFEIKKRT